ncbi:MAG TPA: GNAT family N-acetyltransferase [Gemmatimonadales bacterium]|nr:GNAT family N-acetyltransferase [Gemmatimonadales bacterium]
MRHIRPLRAEDIPDLVALRRRAFTRSQRSDAEMGTYFEQVFLQNPWRDEKTPSLVYAGEDGRPVGFLGVVPRPASFHGEPIRIAVGTQFMVHPDHRGVAGLQLLKEFLSGGQDLSLADLANDASHRLWERLGGRTARIPSLQWTLAFMRVPRPVRVPLRFLLRLVWPRWRPPKGIRRGPLTPKLLTQQLPQLLQSVILRPEYDARSAAWIFDQLVTKRGLGEIRSAVLWDTAGVEVLGWYVYYADAERMGRVVHFVARPGARDLVLQDLFANAWSEGLAAITGRLEAGLLRHAGRSGLTCRREGPWMLMQSSRPEILEAVDRGDAFLSGLEGEGLLSF